MHRRIAAFAVLAMLSSACAWSRPIADRRGGPTAVSGVYSITFNLNIASTLPANATIVCKAQIVPGNALANNFSTQAVPVESASSVAVVTGSTATCVVEIPFSWTVEATRSGVSLNYELDAVNASGTLPAVVRASSQQGIAESYPGSGGTESLTFNVTF